MPPVRAGKGAEAERQKTSDGMAEKLPGLIEAECCRPDQQPLKDTSNPNSCGIASARMAVHPDRFTPGNAAITPNVFLQRRMSPTAQDPTDQGAPAAGTNAAPKKKSGQSKAQRDQPGTNTTGINLRRPTPQGENR